MGYEITWYEQGRVAHVKVYGEFSLEEMHRSSQEIVADYLEKGQPPVHLLVDLLEMEKYPTQLNQVREANKIVMTHLAMGRLVIIGNMNPVVKFLASVVAQFSRIEHRIVATPEEAMEVLRRLDLSLMPTVD